MIITISFSTLLITQITNFLTTTDAVVLERRKLENIRLDLDSAKASLKQVRTTEERNRFTFEVQERQEAFDDGQAIFKGLLSNTLNSLNHQQEGWKMFIECQRDFMTCGATKTDEICSIYTDEYRSPPALLATSSAEVSHSDSYEFVGPSTSSSTEVPVDVPETLESVEEDTEIVHFDSDDKPESRALIKRLYSFLSMKKNTKKITRKPIVNIPTGDTDQDTIQNYKYELEKLMIEKQTLENKLERLTTCPICNEMVIIYHATVNSCLLLISVRYSRRTLRNETKMFPHCMCSMCLSMAQLCGLV